MNKISKWLLKLTLSLTSVLFCFLVLEIAMRTVLPEPDKMLHTDRSKTYFESETARTHPFVKENSEIVNIGVIGDSFTQGAAIQEIDTFSQKLEYMLNLNDISVSVRVNNYGYPGTSTYQQLKILDDALKNGDDIIILEITLNDTEDWTNPKRVIRWRNKIFPSKPEKWVRPIIQNSRLAAYVYGKYTSKKSRAAFVQYYEKLYNPEYSGWKQFVRAIGAFKKRCEAENTPFIAVIFPLFSHDLDERQYPFKDMHQSIEKLLLDNDIHFIDLYDSVKTMNHVRLEAIPGIDPHPSEIAHRIAAEEILEFLVAQRMLDDKFYPKRKGIRHSGTHKHWQKTYEKMRFFLYESKDKTVAHH